MTLTQQLSIQVASSAHFESTYKTPKHSRGAYDTLTTNRRCRAGPQLSKSPQQLHTTEPHRKRRVTSGAAWLPLRRGLACTENPSAAASLACLASSSSCNSTPALDKPRCPSMYTYVQVPLLPQAHQMHRSCACWCSASATWKVSVPRQEGPEGHLTYAHQESGLKQS